MAKRSLKDKIDEESKINFYGNNMKLSEAKTYLERLKAGEVIIELDEKGKMECVSFMNAMKKSDEKRGGKEYFNDYNEMEYVSMILEMRINLQEKFDKDKYCERHGHEEVKDSAHIEEGMGKTRAWAFCSRCGQMYDRYLTQEEIKKWNELLRTPFNI